MKKILVLLLIVLSTVSIADQNESANSVYQKFINDFINFQNKTILNRKYEEECEYPDPDKPKRKNDKSESKVEEEGTGGCPFQH